MRLVLVRHALPERAAAANGAGPDPDLTEQGREQARRLVGALAGEPVDALYTSTMLRARRTAEPLAAARGLTPVPVADLCEYDTDEPEYLPVHEVSASRPELWQRMREGHLPAHIDAGAFRARVVSATERIVAAHPGRATVVVVAHAGVVNAYLAHLLGIDKGLPFPLDYTGVTRVVAGRDGLRRIRTVNEIAHVRDVLEVAAGT